jgi:hypothetical protein
MKRKNHRIWIVMMACMLMVYAICTSRKSNTSTTATSMERKLTPFDDTNWNTGLRLLPKSELLAALTAKNASGKRRLWRLPVIIEIEEGGLGSPRKAYIAVDSTMAPGDRIHLWLHDSALGVSLADRVRQYCGGKSTCRLWVAGIWGPDMLTTLGNEGEKKEGEPYPFSLRAVIGVQGDNEGTNATATVKFRDE